MQQTLFQNIEQVVCESFGRAPVCVCVCEREGYKHTSWNEVLTTFGTNPGF